MNKKFIKVIVIISACLILEILFSNYTAISIKLSKCETSEIDLENMISKDDSGNYKIEDGKIIIDHGRIRFENVNTEIRNICIETDNGFNRYYNAEISFTDNNFSFENGFNYNRSTFQMFIGNNYKNYFSHRSFRKIKTLELNFPTKAIAPFTISSITINDIPPLHFGFFRFGILLLTCFCFFNQAWKWKFSNNDYIVIAMGSVLICLLIIITAIAVNRNCVQPLLDEYPLENTYTSDQYQQLFCAFKAGRLNINVDYSKEEFDNLINPYDKSERDSANLSGDFWDRAYYNGTFYSYFGVAPVFTVYYPVYLFTGKLPCRICASAIVSVYAVIFMSLLYMLILKHFLSDVPYLAAVSGYMALMFGSSVFALCADEYFYYTAVISGIGSLAAFLYFILKSYYEKKFIRRVILLILSGIAAVMIAASRPTMCIYYMSAVIPFVHILKDKNETVKNKIIFIFSIGIPILSGAAGIMIYNYMRFENPFEFGFNYQLTVSTAKANSITLAYIPAVLYHYFLQLPYLTSQFPYIEMNNRSLSSYPHYTYLSSNIGIFTYPVTWGMFLIPLIDKKKDKFKSHFILLLFTSGLLLAFVDMCKAGSHYRYTADILFPIILASIIALFDILYMLKNSSLKLYLTAYAAVLLLMAATTAVGYLLIFSNENKYFINDYSILTQALRSI